MSGDNTKSRSELRNLTLKTLGVPEPVRAALDKVLGATSQAQVEKLYAELEAEMAKASMDEELARRVRDAIAPELLEVQDDTIGLIGEQAIAAAHRHDELAGRLARIEDKLDHPDLTSTPKAPAIMEGPGGAPVKEIPHFTGREAEMQYLVDLFKPETRKDSGCVLISGMGGLGKTSLVIQFVAQKGQELFPEGVYWIRANMMEIDTRRVAKQLGWVEGMEITPGAYIDRELTDKEALLVIDDLSENQVSNGADLSLPKGLTLMTSRETNLGLNVEVSDLDLSVWTLQQSVDYLKSASIRGRQENDVDLARLANFVGNLPLAVQLLAKLIESNRRKSLQDLLILLRSQGSEALDKLDAGAKGQARGIKKVFMATWEALPEADKLILTALATCTKQTSFTILKAISDLDEDELEETLTRLEEISLVDYDEETQEYVVHDVIRLFTSAQSEEEMSEERLKLVRTHLEWVNEHLQDKKGELFTQALSECYRATENAVEAFGFEEVEPTLEQIYSSLAKTGVHYFTALEIINHFLPLIPENTLSKAKWLNLKGRVQLFLTLDKGALKSIDQGISLIEGLLDSIQEEAEKEKWLDSLLEIYMGKIWALLNSGENEEALELCRKVIDMEGARTHASNQTSHLADAYLEAGVALSSMGPEHIEEASEMIRAALPRIQEKYGEDGPELASIYVDGLALFYRKTKDPKTALEYSLKALTIYLNHFGPEHLETVNCYARIAESYLKLGDLDKALEQVDTAVKWGKIVYKDNPFRLQRLYFLAKSIHIERGEDEKVIHYIERMSDVELSISFTRAEKRCVLFMEKARMALYYQKVKKDAKALSIYEEAIVNLKQIEFELPPKDFKETPISLRVGIGALLFFDEVEVSSRDVFGPLLAFKLNKQPIDDVYALIEYIEKQIYQRVFNILIHQQNDIDIIISDFGVEFLKGMLFFILDKLHDQGLGEYQLDEEMPEHEEMDEFIDEDIPEGEEMDEFIDEDIPEGEEMDERITWNDSRVLKIAEIILNTLEKKPEERDDSSNWYRNVFHSTVWNAIGRGYFKKREYESAVSSFNHALSIAEEGLKVEPLKFIGRVYHAQGNIPEAINYLTEALQLMTERFGDDFAEVIELKEELKSIRRGAE